MKFMNIEAERARRGMSKEEFAKFVGIALKTYYNWQNGETDIPSSILLKMSQAFGTSIDYLLESSDNAGTDAS